ncbi:MAG: hypothetical protein JO197_15340 [Acidobacteria bacterium]|nr:hypothetical protein [Acidobacteriota bacterium]
MIGFIGGALIIETTRLTTRGPMIFVPYAAMLVALLGYFRATRAFSFGQRFNATFGSFMLASLMTYVYLSVVVNPHDLQLPLWANVWPVLVMIGIGAITSSVVAAASQPRRQT